MRYVVQTAIEQVETKDGHRHATLHSKVNIPCQSISEANEIADGMRTIPRRQAAVFVEYYLTGGQKVLLSFDDINEMVQCHRELLREGVTFLALAAE